MKRFLSEMREMLPALPFVALLVIGLIEGWGR